jgi:hypothetical protein
LGLQLFNRSRAPSGEALYMAETAPRFDANSATLPPLGQVVQFPENLEAVPVKTAQYGIRVRWFRAWDRERCTRYPINFLKIALVRCYHNIYGICFGNCVYQKIRFLNKIPYNTISSKKFLV